MVELAAKTPLAGLVPVTLGGATLIEADLGRLTSVAPYCGQDRALAAALRAAHGIAAPGPGRVAGQIGARIAGQGEAAAIWFGHRLFLLAGPAPDETLAAHAALADQGDGWACARLEGRGAAQVLARLTPLDLRPGVFRRGQTARTDLRHMAASITRLGDEDFLILVFRAFARTLVHDLRQTMQGVAARGGG